MNADASSIVIVQGLGFHTIADGILLNTLKCWYIQWFVWFYLESDLEVKVPILSCSKIQNSPGQVKAPNLILKTKKKSKKKNLFN